MSDARPKIIAVSADNPSSDALEEAAAALRGGRLVAFPTETVYGLGANALDEASVARIFEAKARPATNPLIVHIAHADDARRLVRGWSTLAARLADAFWPGPLTLVLPKRDDVPDVVTASLETVAVRMPAHPVALELIRLAGVPVAAPSANRYTEVSPTRAEHVVDSLGDAVDIVVDGGPTEVGVESTVLSLVGEQPRILRPGMLTREQLEQVAPGVDYAPTARVEEQTQRPSPGLSRKHYAPLARVHVVDDVRAEIDATGGDEQVGWLFVEPVEPPPEGPQIVLGDTPERYAAGLYAGLRALDRRDCHTIVVQRPPSGERWRAIHDRLSRAVD